MFLNIDEKFKEIGFIKIKEDEYGATYERKNEKYKYTQVLSFLHKASGGHIVQSYDKDLIDKKGIGNTCVGLTVYEVQLCFKKMKKMGWTPDKNTIKMTF